MLEVTGNLWTYPADVRVITTNGTVKKNGECVMGRGCAYEAVNGVHGKCGRWPGLPSILGAWIQAEGNVPCMLGACVTPATGILYSLPVKHNWFEKADLKLIEHATHQLIFDLGRLDGLGNNDIVIVVPRPGCGNGGLKWQDVKPVIEPILDDRFHVITFE